MTARPVVNALEVVLEDGPEAPAGYRVRGLELGPLLGASALGASIYELAPGASVAPYHYEYGNEEWLVVLEGRPTLRQPGGEQVVEPGDLVAFMDGPEGAHKVTNHGEGTVRLLMLSTKREPSVSVFADTGKVLVKPLRKVFRDADAVSYWEGE